MFNPTFYPTPDAVIDKMIEHCTIEGKVILEPSAGSGRIVERAQQEGAKEVLACENDNDLRKILQTKCRILAEDFFTVTSDQVSHVDLILMNPPFNNADAHITHAFNIAPPGCKVIALCNSQTLKNAYSKTRKELETIVGTYGNEIDLGDCFSDADRKTEVNVSMLILDKPGNDYKNEFEGFFMDEDPEEEQVNGVMGYNIIRDLVNRYVECVKIYDDQLKTAVRLRAMGAGYFSTNRENLSISVTEDGVPVERNHFKKAMQKDGWQWVFSKLNLTKHTTRGLREDINKFVETQENIPFTMRNIYKMLEIVIATTGQRMDKAIIEVFDKVTRHHDDNKYNLEGWKTNSHYLLTKRFIMPNLVEVGWSGEIKSNYHNEELVQDLIKALCYITGKNYDELVDFRQWVNNAYFLTDKEGNFIDDSYGKKCWTNREAPNRASVDSSEFSVLHTPKEWGKWFEWGFFKVRCYKKGTIHFEFKDEDVWAKFNQRVAKIKGYPLPEKKEQTKYQDRQNGRKAAQPAYKPTAQKPKVLFTMDI
jgi:16S rRNA G966 N2-methylase RsmD